MAVCLPRPLHDFMHNATSAPFRSIIPSCAWMPCLLIHVAAKSQLGTTYEPQKIKQCSMNTHLKPFQTKNHVEEWWRPCLTGPIWGSSRIVCPKHRPWRPPARGHRWCKEDTQFPVLVPNSKSQSLPDFHSTAPKFVQADFNGSHLIIV